MTGKIAVLLVDDHAVVRAGFRMLLANTGYISVDGEASRGEEVFRLYNDTRPDVVVMDLSMPGIGGLECIRRLCNKDPHAKILVFSIHSERVYVERALQAGAKGYIAKSSAPNILAEAITHIARGATYIESALNYPHPGIIPQPNPLQRIQALSPREFDIFKLLASGYKTREIAAELSIGYKTAANYSTQIKTKLGANTVADLAQLAYMSGIIRGENNE
jgi:DNA-binding NarL/FixJ family response regulator